MNRRNEFEAAKLMNDSEALKSLAVAALEDMKAVNLVVLDVGHLTDVMEYLIVASGTSNRHVKSLAENVVVESKKAQMPPLGVEGQNAGEWVLVDLGGVVVHVMLPATRAFYDIERLWSVQAEPAGSED